MFSGEQIAAITGGRPVGATIGEVTSISTDSRSIIAGQLFVPLRGDRFDGHNYIPELSAKGITATLCTKNWLQNNQLPESVGCIVVQDTLKALGDLAAAWRNRFTLPIIAVTGSNGKTTTKEMLATVLQQTGEGLKTAGNLNNLIGLPLTLFNLKAEDRWAVLELGMSEAGEIDRLASIARPAVGIVLNALPAHLQSMGSLEGVAAAKGELLHRITDNGLAVINADDPLVAALHQNQSARRISFGIRRGEVRAEEITLHGNSTQSFRVVTPGGRFQLTLKALGRHNIYNALATTAALYERLPLETIAAGLESFTPYSGRFRLERLQNGLILIDDSYNSNPASSAAALETVRQIKGDGRALIALGSMLELGTDEGLLHQQLGALAAAVADRLYLYGGLKNRMADGAFAAGMNPADVMLAEEHQEIASDIMKHAAAGDLILLKGSRGMRMEIIADSIRTASGGEN